MSALATNSDKPHPIGGRRGAWPGFKTRAWPQCRWAAARPGWASPSDTSAAGVEGAGGTCRGAGGRRRGLAGLRADTPISNPVPLVWRAPEGPEGTGGLRGAAPNEVRSPSLAGGRGLRRLEHPWSHEQHASSCWAAAHRHTQRPGPARRTLRYAERLGPAVRTAAAALSVGGGQIQGFDGGLEGGGCLLVLV